MRQEFARWALETSDLVAAFAIRALPLTLLVVLTLVTIRRTRSLGGFILFVFSFLTGVSTWLLGSALSFASFGWFGLIVGLGVMGVGVVPLGIVGGFIYLESRIAIWLIGMVVVTYLLRLAGLWLMGRGE